MRPFPFYPEQKTTLPLIYIFCSGGWLIKRQQLQWSEKYRTGVQWFKNQHVYPFIHWAKSSIIRHFTYQSLLSNYGEAPLSSVLRECSFTRLQSTVKKLWVWNIHLSLYSLQLFCVCKLCVSAEKLSIIFGWNKNMFLSDLSIEKWI